MTGSRFGRRAFLKAAGLTVAAASTGTWPRCGYGARKPMPDVVVLLPGITGSVLRKDNRDIWGLSFSNMVTAIRTLGRNLDTLKLTEDPPDADDLGDGVVADRVFPDVHLIPGLWKIDGYTTVAQRIMSEFDVERGRNFFEFPYDWRRDNRVAARRLARMSHDWLTSWRASGNSSAKLILVGHSMGGLVARYFLECLNGWRDTRRLITFGTPYGGSLNALGFIANGFKKQLAGITLADLTELLRSFTSVYQLLPRYECYDAGDGRLVRVGETTGIPGVDPLRAARALEFHREIERAVDAHLKEDAYLQNRYSIHPIVGTYQPTLQSAKLASNKKVELSYTYPGEDLDGDGTVPRPSATPIELAGKGTEMYAAAIHGSLQNTEPVLVQLMGLLSPAPRKIFRAIPPAVSLSVDDAYAVGEPIGIHSQCENGAAQLTAVVVNVQTGLAVAHHRMQRGADGVFKAACAPLPEGTYRVTVDEHREPTPVSAIIGKVDPVSDVFIVSGT